MKISIFFNARVHPAIKKNNSLFSRSVLSGLGSFKNKPGQVCLIFTYGAQIKKINRKFLKKDRITDVIAFNYGKGNVPMSPSPTSAGEMPFGDIFVCVDRAKRQAEKFGHTFLKELLILSVHGALHLAGMDDNTPEKRLKMQKKAEKIVGFKVSG